MNAVVFLDLLIIASSKCWPGSRSVLGCWLWRQLPYVSMTFGADGLPHTSLPQLTQTRVLLPTSKLSSECWWGEALFNLRILFGKLTSDSWSASRHHELPHHGFIGGLLPFCRALRTPQRRPWRPVSAVWWGWFLVVWASWSPCCLPPSPGRCLSPAWCPALHHRFSLQTEASALNWVYITRWSAVGTSL